MSSDSANAHITFAAATASAAGASSLLSPSLCVSAAPSSASGKLLATGAADGAVKLWSLACATFLLDLRAHTAAVTCLSFSHDENLLVSGAADKTCIAWHTNNGRLIRTYVCYVTHFRANRIHLCSARFSSRARTALMS